ncbi:DUF167 domain-containing protein [Pelotomaculum isophthalicicum JI]|uniref:UPF0235 protein L7E55_10445 n=1 Tax=Pelotomaculum isophthalicicum JI TaxID=947010 RepID=A0A9X4JTH2_9FIRM|nr:DUF167 domain-containing protein [Pelotomaculum isophthalicicum]MDF9408769.1 DUF167 domain-containing protein [Pelotomaculum isophthalicicum JI]
MLYIREEKDGVIFKVRVQPRASGNGVAGLFEDAVKLRLTAPPVEGEANEACRTFLAKLLSVPRSHVEILSGSTGRNKTIKVLGISAEKALNTFAPQD